MAKKKKKFSILRLLLSIVLIAVLLAGGYLGYVALSFHRIGSMALEPKGEGKESLETGKEYSLLSWNIGFGAYESDFDFFLDGGSQARAWSPERLDRNLSDIVANVARMDSDFNLFQEVDIDSTRSYHRDEAALFAERLKNRSYVFCQNYDSPYILYPLNQPHGQSRSGLMSFSKFYIATADRVELPIEKGVLKLLDLDRCYSKSRIKLDSGKDLLLYNLHLSAYSSDGSIADEQLQLLLQDMEAEYQKGNYCIGGGDFNKDLLGNSAKIFGVDGDAYTWAQPIPGGVFDGLGLTLVAPFDEANPKPSCRNPDSAYNPEQFVVTVDGFIASDNVEVVSSKVIPYEFRFSDHNPVELRFKLK